MNITIVDDYLNKRVIRDKAPSRYIGDFLSINPQIDIAFKSQLIPELEESGVLNDDFWKFFNKRLNKIVEFLLEKIIPQETGNEVYEDTDEDNEIELLTD